MIITTTTAAAAAYTAAFPQSGSSSAGIWFISAPYIGQVASTGEILFSFREVLWVFGRPSQWLNIPPKDGE